MAASALPTTKATAPALSTQPSSAQEPQSSSWLSDLINSDTTQKVVSVASATIALISAVSAAFIAASEASASAATPMPSQDPGVVPVLGDLDSPSLPHGAEPAHPPIILASSLRETISGGIGWMLEPPPFPPNYPTNVFNGPKTTPGAQALTEINRRNFDRGIIPPHEQHRFPLYEGPK